MSTTKKKRMGSQRRPLNAQEPPQATSRQRADAKADLTLSPDSAQSETSPRKKKSENKGKLQFKDVTTEPSHEPVEEVEGSAISISQILGFAKKSNFDSQEKDMQSTFPESEAADSNMASSVSLSTKPEAKSRKSVIPDTTSEVAQSGKDLTEVASSEEGVLREKDQAQQMPDIFEATLPAGVTGESSHSVGLIEREEISVTGSHDHDNKQNAGDEAGLSEKPVLQEGESSLPIAKARKMGSSRRKKVINPKEDEAELAKESSISSALETTEEGQVDMNLTPKINEDKIDMSELEKPDFEDVLVKIKTEVDQIEEPKLSDDQSDILDLSLVGIPPAEDTLVSVSSPHHLVTDNTEILVTGGNSTLKLWNETDETNNESTNQENTTEFAVTLKDDEASFDYFATGKENKSEKEVKDESLVSWSLLSEPESDKTKLTKDETTIVGEPLFSVETGIPSSAETLLYFDKNEEYNLISDAAGGPSVDQAAPSEDNFSVESEDGGDTSIVEQPQPLVSFSDGVTIVPEQIYKEEQEEEPFFTPDVSVNEAKIVEIEESSSQPVSLLQEDVTNTMEESLNTAAVVQKQIENDTDLKEKTNIDSENEDSDASSVSEDTDESSSESVSSPNAESVEPKLVFKTNIEDAENINLLGQPSEPLISFTDGVSTDSSEIKKEEDQKEIKHEKVEGEVTTADSEDALSTEKESLATKDIQQSEPIKEEENVKIDDAEVREPSVSNKEMEFDLMKEKMFEVEPNIPGLDQNVSKMVEAEINEPTTKITDDINAALATTQPDAAVSVEDGSPAGPLLTGHRRKLGSSRRIKGRKQDNDEPNQEEINIKPEGKVEESEIEEKSQEIIVDNDVVAEETLVQPEIAVNDEIQATVEKEEVKSLIEIHDEALETNDESLKSTKVTALLETESQETSTEPKEKAEQSGVNTESYAFKEAINVHQLTYISDSETHEEMEDFTLQQAKQPVPVESIVEPSETVKMTTTPDVSLVEKTKEIPDVNVDSVTIKDLKDKDIVGAEGLSDVYIDGTSSQIVAGSEEMISAKIDDAIESDVTSAESITKEQDGIKETNAEPPKRKMGSTRRSLLNKKQQDEEDNATISVNAAIDEKDNGTTVSEESAQALSQPGNQGEATLDATPVKNESTEGQAVTLEDKEKILQTEMVEPDKGVTTTLPIAAEEIQPSSPGKRRKMGSTRKNLLSKKESPEEESVIAVNVEREEVASVSNDNTDSKEHSGLLVYTATVHQPPPDEETPLSQKVSQEEPRSESKGPELPSQPEAMAEDAAVARRRKMGSHRKPHSDQSSIQRRVTGSEESPIHPLGEPKAEPAKLTLFSEVGVGDNKAVSSATASRPLSERISQQPPQPTINVRRNQESVRIAAGSGYGRSSRYEVVMIGDSSVGKTSFIQRAQSGKFAHSDIPASIGMDSYRWTVDVNGKSVTLHLWDTAGQERFRSMTKQIFHRAQAFLLMYDVTCTQTFCAVSYWANCIKEGAAEDAVVLLLGNKCDRKERKVSREEGELLAEENRFAFMECSAATGENVLEALETVARLLSQNADRSRSEDPLLLRKPEPKNKLGCC